MAKIKIRGVGKENKKYMRQFPSGPARGLFGLGTIKKSDKIVVMTEGELDAMSVYQMTGIPSLSLPQGANSLPDLILPYLDQF
jgi:twinkle protein